MDRYCIIMMPKNQKFIKDNTNNNVRNSPRKVTRSLSNKITPVYHVLCNVPFLDDHNFFKLHVNSFTRKSVCYFYKPVATYSKNSGQFKNTFFIYMCVYIIYVVYIYICNIMHTHIAFFNWFIKNYFLNRSFLEYNYFTIQC